MSVLKVNFHLVANHTIRQLALTLDNSPWTTRRYQKLNDRGGQVEGLPLFRRPFSTRDGSLRRIVLFEVREHLDGRNGIGAGRRIHKVDASEFPFSGAVDKNGRDADVVVDEVTVDVQKTQHPLKHMVQSSSSTSSSSVGHEIKVIIIIII